MNRKISYICNFGLMIYVFFSFGQFANAETPKLKSTEVDFFDQASQRPAKVKFWYQAATNICEGKICLRQSQNKHKVAVISHGAFGSPHEMSWLGYALASQGWLVAGVAHFGESWVYGTETIDPSVVSKFWQRPQEVSFVIDSLSEKGIFNLTLQTNNILMFGHSSGGFTALAMAGAKLEAGKSEAYCSSAESKGDKGCDYGSQRKVPSLNDDMLKKIGSLQAQMQDSRIRAVIALDPALGHAVSESSLKGIKTPTLIIGSVDNDFLPFTRHAKYYAEQLQNAELIGVEQGAGHFIYLNECDYNREVKGVPLCKDREGVNRHLIQKELLNQVFTFIYSKGLNEI